MNDIIPLWIASWPNDGPIMSSCTIFTLAAIFPDFNTFARSFASSGVKFPEIWEFPPEISVFTTGNEYTWSSKTIATQRPIFSRVNCSHILEPSAFIDILTTAEFVIRSKSSRASVITSPSRGGRPPFVAFNATNWKYCSFSSIGFTVHLNTILAGKSSRTWRIAKYLFTAAVSFMWAIPTAGPFPIAPSWETLGLRRANNGFCFFHALIFCCSSLLFISFIFWVRLSFNEVVAVTAVESCDSTTVESVLEEVSSDWFSKRASNSFALANLLKNSFRL